MSDTSPALRRPGKQNTQKNNIQIFSFPPPPTALTTKSPEREQRCCCSEEAGPERRVLAGDRPALGTAGGKAGAGSQEMWLETGGWEGASRDLTMWGL